MKLWIMRAPKRYPVPPNQFGCGGVLRSMNVRKRFAATALFIAALPSPRVAPFAQTAFDVASVRENTDPGTPQRLLRTPDGGLTAQHFPARFLITIAFRLQPYQLVGLPGWADRAYYDVRAKPAPGSSTTRDQMSDMLQALLVDRFKLTFHREKREMEGYVLVRVKPDSLGPGMNVSAIDCEKTPAAKPCLVIGDASSAFVVSGAPIWTLQQQLVAEVNAPIDDQTGLTATYDFNLPWSRDLTAPSDVPAIFTALQEQLGLKLERRRVVAEVFVIDMFERPTTN